MESTHTSATTTTNMDTLQIITLISGILVAAASGMVGSILVVRKMTLLSDALSHVALPGIALGILFNVNPLMSGIAVLFLGVLLIWYIETKTNLAIESITGVLFVTALAIGALLIPQQDILEAFFGSVKNMGITMALTQSGIALLIIAVTLYYLKPLALSAIAPDLSTAARVSQSRMELFLLILIAFTIAVGVSFVGVLLMSALLIVPAVTAKNIANSFKGFISMSAVLASLSLAAGLLLSNVYGINPGLTTVLISSCAFFVSLAFRKKTL